MKKRILAVLLIMCFALTLGTVTVSASEASLQMEFSAPVLRVGTPATIIISAPEGAVSATALFSDNGKFVVDRSNMKYNSVYEKYEVELAFENGVCEIPVTPKYTGVATVALSNIVVNMGEETVSANDVSIQTLLKPKAIEIYTKQDLANVSNDLSNNYVLMNDIDFTEEDFAEGGQFYNNGYGWKPIGACLSQAFKGSFDGNGFTIRGLRVFKADYNYIGLFGINNGTIENLVLEDIVIDATYGVFVPTAESTTSSGKIDYESKDVWTPPTGSVNDSDLSGYDRTGLSSAVAGGVVGYNIGTISDCCVYASVSATPVAAGIAASNVGTIQRCYANVSVNAKVAGAVSGYNLNHGNINNCHVKGDVFGSVMAGGLSAENRSSKILNSYTFACVSGEVNVAAATNGEYYSTVTNVYYLSDENVTDSKATAYTYEEFSALTFTEDCWDYSLEYPVLSKFLPYILNEEQEPEYLQGDIDGDGLVNAADLACLKKLIAELATAEELNAVNPNVDMDSESLVNAADLAMLKKIIAKV